MKRLTPVENLHDQILEDTGIDLPIGLGSGLSIDDPSKMLVLEHYGHTEANIISFYLRNYELLAWDVVKHEQVIVGDRKIDCIELSVSESPDDMNNAWTEKYYFDITDCL